MNVAQDIVPINEFKSRASRMIREVRRTRRPLVVTQNGRAAAVVLAPEEFDRIRERARVVAGIERGIADADAGRGVSDAEAWRELESEP